MSISATFTTATGLGVTVGNGTFRNKTFFEVKRLFIFVRCDTRCSYGTSEASRLFITRMIFLGKIRVDVDALSLSETSAADFVEFFFQQHFYYNLHILELHILLYHIYMIKANFKTKYIYISVYIILKINKKRSS